jgi:hypothetical protein
MDLMVSTLRLSSVGVLTLDTVPSADLLHYARWTAVEPVIRAEAGFMPSKVMPLASAVEPLTWALAVFPDVLAALQAHVLATVEQTPELRDVRTALFS